MREQSSGGRLGGIELKALIWALMFSSKTGGKKRVRTRV